jgi:hypothetical protein
MEAKMQEERSGIDVARAVIFILILLATLGRVMRWQATQTPEALATATRSAALAATAEAWAAGTPWAPEE